MNSVGVIGGGNWGTALAHLMAEKGYQIDLWVFEEDVCQAIRKKRENSVYLPGIQLPREINATCSLEEVAKKNEVIFLVSPSHIIRKVVKNLMPFLKSNCLLINAAKGIENDSLLTISEVLKQILPPTLRLATISGPTFAEEIARRVPSAIVSASEAIEDAERVKQILSTSFLKVFTSSDVLGVELGGALKNVIAISAGIADGLKLGYNTRAALITRGLIEMKRIGTSLGARPETFSGLTGMGDLLLTCTGNLSRNRTVGIQLGQGKKLSEITNQMNMVAEGIKTVKSARALVKKLGVKASVIEETYLILHEGKSPQDALRDLLNIRTTSEFSGIKGL